MNHQRTGISRSNRAIKNLLGSPFQIDSRSFTDVLGYMAKYMERINFYDLNNIPNDNWQKILRSDPIIYITIVINQSTSTLEQQIKNLSINGIDSHKSQSNLVQELIDWHQNIQTWHDNLEALGEYKLAQKINNVLVDVLGFQKRNLVKYKEGLKPTRSLRLIEPIKISSLSITPPKASHQIDLEEIANNYYRIILHLKQVAKHYLERNLLNRNTHQPNNALYITFALLFKNIQNSTNKLSQKHLDFYYKEVLKQENKKGKPTRSVVTFELQPSVKSTKIESNTLLSAGKPFEKKNEVIFKTEKPLIAYNVELTELKTILFNRNPNINIGTNNPTISAVQLKPLISKGKEVADKMDWFTFGANKSSLQNTQINAKYTANIGFIIGSPILQLSTGNRTINLRFNLEKDTSKKALWNLFSEIKTNTNSDTSAIADQLFKYGFKIYYTTYKSWEKFASYEVSLDQASNSFTLQLELPASCGAIEKLSSVENNLKWPSIKVLLNEYSHAFLYSFFLGVEIDSIDIKVNVNSIRQLSLYNNLGKLPSDNSVEPFGPSPSKGDYLLIGYSELFQKQIDELFINIQWANLPSDFGGFEAYYKNYSEAITNTSFEVSKSVLSNGFWLPTKTTSKNHTQLFKTEACVTPEGYESVKLQDSSTIIFGEYDKLGIVKSYDLKPPLVFNTETQTGFVKLTLCSPEVGFGNTLYHKDYTEIATFNAKNKAHLPLPNQPYVPKASNITIAYKASKTIHFNAAINDLENKGTFSHITPFGQKLILQDQIIYKRTLVCDNQSQGYLILGLKGLTSTTTITLFFHFLRSSTTVQLSTSKLTWEYFSNNHWVALKDSEIIQDNTNGFTKSGIVELTLPHYKNYYEEKSDVYYVRVSTKQEVENYPIIKGIYVNAVEVSCINTDLDLIGKVIPAGSIHQAVNKLFDVKGIYQPSESGGGILAEHGEQMYQRVCERLRHKQRAVSLWDYERLILGNFDGVKMVKCTNLGEDFKPLAGKVKVVVLNEQWTKEERHYFSLKALNNMKVFLQSKTNSHVTIEVVNPLAEYLLVNCLVEFMPENNGGYYHNLLDEEISDFLSPFSRTEKGIGGIGGSLAPTTVGSFIENRPYIKKLNDLSIEHIIHKGPNRFVLGIYRQGEEINVKTPWSIFIPSNHHKIVPASTKKNVEINNGLGNLEIGLDFILNNEASGQQAGIKNSNNTDGTLSDDSILVFNRKP